MADPSGTGRFSLREPNHRPARFATPQGWGEMGHNDPATSWLKPWPNARNRRRTYSRQVPQPQASATFP
ncbi:hypothetical protein [Azospirillum melinis]